MVCMHEHVMCIWIWIYSACMNVVCIHEHLMSMYVCMNIILCACINMQCAYVYGYVCACMNM